MDIVLTATRNPYACGIKRRVALDRSTDDLTVKLNRHKVLCCCGGFCQHIPPSNFIDLTADRILAQFIAFGQRTVCVEETVICGDENVCTLHIVDDNTKNVGNLLHSVFASLKHLFLGWSFVTNGINRVVVDIHNFFAAHKLTALGTFHVQNVRVLDCHTVHVRSTENLATLISRTGGHFVHENIHAVIDRQLSPRKKSRHTELCD